MMNSPVTRGAFYPSRPGRLINVNALKAGPL